MEKKTFKVPNIGCDGCVRTIKTELSELQGVQSVEGEANSKTVTVEYNEPATWEQIVSKLTEIDYAPENA
ncbi:MAG: cation transporter [Chloroflexi bacterium]|nr:MAG: cation transporter [Chloroflexota bacterium]